MTNVVKWPNVIANYLENDNVMLLTSRENVSWEFTLFLWNKFFSFPKNIVKTSCELKFGCESVLKSLNIDFQQML